MGIRSNSFCLLMGWRTTDFSLPSLWDFPRPPSLFKVLYLPESRTTFPTCLVVSNKQECVESESILRVNSIYSLCCCVCLCAQRGCCPDLELLEVNTMLDSTDCELPVYIQALQMACPKLKVRVWPLTEAGRFMCIVICLKVFTSLLF